MVGGVRTLWLAPKVVRMNPEIHGPLLKGRTRKQIKARKDRAEAKVKRSVRQQCADRDPRCRIERSGPSPEIVTDAFGACSGESEWAHMHAKRRSQTRGQAPEVRHDTAHSLMLCRFHHTEYDAHRLLITAVSRRGADGPLKFRRKDV